MQRKNMWLAMSALVSLLWVHTEVVAQEQACYQIGETIAPEVTVVNANGEQQNLLELIDSETKLIYLVIFGGPSLNPEHSEGGLWCEDSFNDLPISNFIARKYGEKGVKVVPVVCPPVYHERRFGYPVDAFMKTAQSENSFQKAFKSFVGATAKLQNARIIPFETVYFDPQFRLMFNYSAMSDVNEYAGEMADWLGKLKPCGDDQRYSTPTIWLLSPQGEVLHAPFYGNRFMTGRLKISFTIRDVDAAVAELLAK
ncbi:hypothetical protein KC734_09555 [candidate division KSB1 bacterium]|nr:hypothetical protein [candidate division KSB1 bacterium]